MTSVIASDEHNAFVEMVANQLTSQFIPQVRLLCSRNNFYTHAGILAEIYEWSLEFFHLYYDEFSRFAEPWDVEEAAVAFGQSKFSALAEVDVYLDRYFLAKYNTLAYAG